MVTDTKTDTVVLIHYTPGCGGKFLSNCLALSSNAVLQHQYNAELQCENKFTPRVKLKFLLYQLSRTKDSWTDLGMGCLEYFGVGPNDWYKQPEEINFYPTVQKVIERQWKSFLMVHSFRVLKRYLEVWPNATLIIIENCNFFIDYRGGDMRNLLGTCGTAKSFAEQISKPYITWDARWFLDKKTMMVKIKDLAETLKLDLDTAHVDIFYDRYIATIDKLREQSNEIH